MEFREECQKRGLNPRTIESNVSDIMTLVKAARGVLLDPGRRLKLPRPEPQPVSPKTLEACWPHFPEWLRQWVVLSYWTGLRLAVQFCWRCDNLISETRPMADATLCQSDLLTRKELAALLRTSTRNLGKMIADGIIPRPMYIGASSPRWRRADVDARLAQLAEAAQQGAAQ